jgi:hypothetical protein
MSVQMDVTFAEALRAALVEHVETTAAPARPRRRPHLIVLSLAGLAVAGGGVAMAAQLLAPSPPGSDVVTLLAPAVVVSGSGTQTIELGPPPAGANRIDIKLACLTAGTFTTADGANLQCTNADVAAGGPGAMLYGLPLFAGQHSTTITAAAGSRWRLVAAYSTVQTSAWGVNARGETYGAVNAHGTPDLIAVIATNGKTGYAYAAQLLRPEPTYTSPVDALAGQGNQTQFTVPVYEPDGQTVIGEFVSY